MTRSYAPRCTPFTEAEAAIVRDEWAARGSESPTLFDYRVGPMIGRSSVAVERYRQRVGLSAKRGGGITHTTRNCIWDREEESLRPALEQANQAFLKALSGLKPVNEPPVKPEPTVRMLPPPSLSAEAYC